MPTRQLYNITIPADSQTDAGLQGLGHQIESLAGEQTDAPIIETLGVQSGDQSITASFANQRAQVTAAELEELLSASGFDTLPYYTPSDPGRQGDGWISVEDGSVERASVHEDRVQSISGTFTRSGGRGNYRRSLEVSPQPVPRNDYGNETSALVAIPSAAEKRTWYNRETSAREPVAVVETVTCEGGHDVDLIDAQGVDLSKPELVYDAGYSEHRVDVVLWDTRGFSARNDPEDGELQWARCYTTRHEYSGAPVIDTGRLRLRLDEQAGISAETYNPTQDTWNPVGLPDSDWSLRDTDITRVSPVRITAQLEFQHPSEGAFALNALARRGRETVQFVVPESITAATPAGLRELLDGIAGESVRRPQASLGLISREEVRR
jgi:hypothetical protein